MATQHQLLNRDEKQSISNCFSLGENTQNSFLKRVKCFQERKNSFQKTISQIGFLIIICLIPLLSVSQKIKWATAYNGKKSPMDYTNAIKQSVFDSEGNLLWKKSLLAKINNDMNIHMQLVNDTFIICTISNLSSAI